jgi:hypothetical protein
MNNNMKRSWSEYAYERGDVIFDQQIEFAQRNIVVFVLLIVLTLVVGGLYSATGNGGWLLILQICGGCMGIVCLYIGVFAWVQLMLAMIGGKLMPKPVQT